MTLSVDSRRERSTRHRNKHRRRNDSYSNDEDADDTPPRRSNRDIKPDIKREFIKKQSSPMVESDTSSSSDSSKSSQISSSSDTDNEVASDHSEMDLTKEYKPISEYVNNRREMTRQMFHALKGKSLKKLIPRGLRGIKHDDLQEMCIDELEVMSKKRIKRTLRGEAMSSGSSSSESESEQENENIDERPENASNDPETPLPDSTTSPKVHKPREVADDIDDLLGEAPVHLSAEELEDTIENHESTFFHESKKPNRQVNIESYPKEHVEEETQENDAPQSCQQQNEVEDESLNGQNEKFQVENDSEDTSSSSSTSDTDESNGAKSDKEEQPIEGKTQDIVEDRAEPIEKPEQNIQDKPKRKKMPEPEGSHKSSAIVPISGIGTFVAALRQGEVGKQYDDMLNVNADLLSEAPTNIESGVQPRLDSENAFDHGSDSNTTADESDAGLSVAQLKKAVKRQKRLQMLKARVEEENKLKEEQALQLPPDKRSKAHKRPVLEGDKEEVRRQQQLEAVSVWPPPRSEKDADYERDIMDALEDDYAYADEDEIFELETNVRNEISRINEEIVGMTEDNDMEQDNDGGKKLMKENDGNESSTSSTSSSMTSIDSADLAALREEASRRKARLPTPEQEEITYDMQDEDVLKYKKYLEEQARVEQEVMIEEGPVNRPMPSKRRHVEEGEISSDAESYNSSDDAGYEAVQEEMRRMKGPTMPPAFTDRQEAREFDSDVSDKYVDSQVNEPEESDGDDIIVEAEWDEDIKQEDAFFKKMERIVARIEKAEEKRGKPGEHQVAMEHQIKEGDDEIFEIYDSDMEEMSDDNEEATPPGGEVPPGMEPAPQRLQKKVDAVDDGPPGAASEISIGPLPSFTASKKMPEPPPVPGISESTIKQKTDRVKLLIDNARRGARANAMHLGFDTTPVQIELNKSTITSIKQLYIQLKNQRAERTKIGAKMRRGPTATKEELAVKEFERRRRIAAKKMIKTYDRPAGPDLPPNPEAMDYIKMRNKARLHKQRVEEMQRLNANFKPAAVIPVIDRRREIKEEARRREIETAERQKQKETAIKAKEKQERREKRRKEREQKKAEKKQTDDEVRRHLELERLRRIEQEHKQAMEEKKLKLQYLKERQKQTNKYVVDAVETKVKIRSKDIKMKREAPVSPSTTADGTSKAWRLADAPDEESDIEIAQRMASNISADDTDPTADKDTHSKQKGSEQLEMFELEMRAKAIESLLKRAESK